MTQFEHVFDGLRDAPRIVDGDIADQMLGAAQVAEYDANSRRRQFGSCTLLERRSHDRDPANITFDQLPDYGLGARLHVFGIEEQNVESPVPGGGLKSADNFRKVGICDFRNYQSEQIAPARRQSPRMNVLIVVQLAHYFEDPMLGLGRDVLGFVEHT